MAFSLKIGAYRCFTNEPQGIDDVGRINIIIGRNNSGKSSLLDMVEFACDPSTDRASTSRAVLHYRVDMNESHLEAFSGTTSGGSLPQGITHRAYASKFLGRKLAWLRRLGQSAGHQFKMVERPAEQGGDLWDNILGLRAVSPLEGRPCLRLGAARDVEPDSLDSARNAGKWSEDGSNVTCVLTAFLHQGSQKKETVTKGLLERLNQVVAPDVFSGIDTRLNGEQDWEVYLAESGKAAEIPLSQSGAGLKTILCVLSMMELRPRLLHANEPQGRSKMVYCLEELENNLHPTLQRRLLKYVRDRAVETDSTVFLTTHSPTVIDFFEGDDEARLVHVVHDGVSASVRSVVGYKAKHSIIDDIGAKASDLLQANCVVWVEGPSGRIYFNRWIELWTEGELREGAHYQCMFYGGSLLAHVSADDPEFQTELVRLLRLNRNAVGLFDHDGDTHSAPLKPHVQRMLDELSENRGYGWVTLGREVENYLPTKLLIDVAELTSRKAKSPFTNVPKVLQNDKQGQYAKSYRNKGKKVWLAYDMREHMTRADLEAHLDLKTRLDEVVAYIRKVNLQDQGSR